MELNISLFLLLLYGQFNVFSDTSAENVDFRIIKNNGTHKGALINGNTQIYLRKSLNQTILENNNILNNSKIYNVKLNEISINKNSTNDNSKNLYLIIKKNATVENVSERALTTEEPEEIFGFVTSPNYPKAYDAKGSMNFSKKFDAPYGIDITVEDLDINGEEGDYLLIKSGTSMEDAGTGVILTWKIDTPKHYRIMKSESVFILFVVQKRSPFKNKMKGFKIKWERYGEETTETPKPTTEVPLPTQSNGNRPEITVYIDGKTPIEFVDSLDDFEQLLITMANVYCNDKNIPLDAEITSTNILISHVAYCPISWPNIEKCTAVTFSIPVFLNESVSKPNDYELDADHLKEMWLTYSEELLSQMNLISFKAPNETIILSMWLSISVGIMLLFIVFIYVLYRNNFFVDEFNQQRYTERESILFEKKPRESDSSLFPTVHQEVPPMLYDSDLPNNDTQYDSWFFIEPQEEEIYTSPPPSYTTDDSNVLTKRVAFLNEGFTDDFGHNPFDSKDEPEITIFAKNRHLNRQKSIQLNDVETSDSNL